MAIVLTIFVFLALFSITCIFWAYRSPVALKNYNVVRAGDVDGAIRLFEPACDITNYQFVSGGEPVRVADFLPFIVNGESMSMNDIHTHDIVLVQELTGDERLHLEKDNIIVFTYFTKEEPANVAYKLRQFIDYIKINDEIDIDNWCAKHNIQEVGQFKAKYLKAKERPTHDSEIYLCSKTWHNNKLDYSFHSIVNLKGRVRYSIPADKLK